MTRLIKALALGVAATTVACDQNPVAPPATDFEVAAVLAAIPSVTVGDVIVCKDATSGQFDFTLSNVSNFNPSVGSPFGIDATAANPCVSVGNAPDHNGSLTVTEVLDPAYDLTKIEVYKFTGDLNNNSGVPSLLFTEPTEAFVSVTPNNDEGFVIVFYNEEIPDEEEGCTLTQGYWKTHSENGPAPYDATWALLPGGLGASTLFFGGATWYDVFHTPVAGNQYYNLAHQYMAAVLNGLNGASAPQEVSDAIADADVLFNTYTPAQVAAMKGNDPVRQEFVALAGTLGSYNEGLIGPGHCED